MKNDKPVEELKVLLVEENPDYAALLINQLNEVSSTPKIRVTHLRSVAEAQACLKTETFPVLLLDLNLSDSSAIESLILIQKTTPTIPVIALATEDNAPLSKKLIQKEHRTT